MKYYINRVTGEIFAYESDGSQDSCISADLELLSDEEYAEIRAVREAEPDLTPDQLIARFRAVIQEHMDAAARLAGYDDIKAAVTYAEEPAVPKFQAEGKVLRAWRSLVWAYGYEQIDAVKSGARLLPTPEQLIAELPPLVMP